MMKQISVLLLVLFLGVKMLLAAPLNTGHKTGDIAPGFELKALNGDAHSLASLKTRGHVLLVFWATECVYCYAHVGDFKKIHQQYSSKGLTLAAINIGGEYDMEVEEYVKDNQLNYLVLSDRLNNLDVAEAYHVVGTPTLVLVSPEGRIVFRGHNIPDLTKWLQL